MSENNTAGAGDDLNVAEDLRQAVNGFVTDFRGFRGDIETKMQQTEERMTMLDRKMTQPVRTPLSAAHAGAAPHQLAFQAYLRNGDDDGLRGLELEGKSLSTAVNSDGGYLVDPQTSERVQSVLNATASIRAIASVVRVEATSYDVLVDHTDVGAGWATESDPTVESDTPQIEPRSGCWMTVPLTSKVGCRGGLPTNLPAPRPALLSTATGWTSPRACWRIAPWTMTSGSGAIWAMCRRALTGM
jgi:HK97 family phage major capsid protein